MARAVAETIDAAGAGGPAPPAGRPGGLSDRALMAVTAAVTLPILWLGYGTDLDIGAVLRTGALIRAGDYAPSRNPGVPVVEALVAALDPLGGHLLVNLATAAALAATVVGVARLVPAWGHPNGDLLALAFLASPIVIISGTQTADFIWALALYVPAWLAAGRTAGFLVAGDDWVSLGNNLGRSLVKNVAVAGVPLVVLLGAAVPALVRSLRRWGADPMVRFAVLALAATEVLYLRMPWKPAHLLPGLLALVLWIGAGDRNRRPFLWLLVAAIAVNGLVTFRPVTSDNPDAATGATFAPTVTIGWLVNDVRCRVRYMEEPPRIDSGSWSCTLRPMRG
jgi:hypothetical protein